MSSYFRTFDFMKRFQCTGPDCEDTCCSGWKVNLYRKDYKKIKDLLESDPKLGKYKPCLLLNEPDKRLDVNWGALDFGEGGHCGMMEDGWCMLHRDHGVKYLPTVCATFPRLIYEFKKGWEVNGRLSCPEVARLCLLSPTPPVPEDDDKAMLPEIYETNAWAKEKGGFYKAYLEDVSAAIRKLLYIPGFTVAERNYFILYLCRKIEPFYHLGVAKDPGSRLKRVLARFGEEKFLRNIAENFAKTEPDPRVGVLVLAIGNARLKGPNFKRYNDLVTKVLQSYAANDGRLAREGIIDEEVSRDAVWQAFLTRRAMVERLYGEQVERYFHNFTINFWSQLIFVGDADLMVPSRKILIYLLMTRFLFFSHPNLLQLLKDETPLEEASEVLDAAVVEVVQIFMKNIDANFNMLKSFLSSMEVLGFSDLNRLTTMLKV